MKKLVLKSIIIMMVALVSQAAGAQKIVTNVSTEDFGACKSYLDEHPQDTIVNGDVKVFSTNGIIARTGSAVKPVFPSPTRTVRQDVESVHRSGATTDVEYVNGSGTTFTRTRTDRVAYSDKVAEVNGQKMAVKPGNKDVEGNLRHTVYMSLLAGGMYVVDDHEFQPVVTLKGGFESCHFLFELDVTGTFMQYTDSASVAGHHYSCVGFYAGAGWKVFQDSRYRSYLAIGGSVGYSYQRTDAKNAEIFSDNYGLAGKAWLRGNLSLGNHWGLLLEGGYNLLPKVYHQENQDHQDLNHGGAYLQVGLNYRFNR